MELLDHLRPKHAVIRHSISDFECSDTRLRTGMWQFIGEQQVNAPLAGLPRS